MSASFLNIKYYLGHWTSADIDIIMLYLGGFNSPDEYDEILEFHPDTEKWSLAGRMIRTRYSHAVTTVNFEDVFNWC